MTTRLKTFSTVHPMGETPGMEPVRLDVLKAAVNNAEAQSAAPVAPVLATFPATPQPVLVNKNIRLPADLVEFIDYVYTKEKRIKKQDAYTQALEAFFRPLMAR